MQFSIRLLMSLTAATAVFLFSWMNATPVALFMLTLVPAAILVIARRKFRNGMNSLYHRTWILFAATCLYVGTIGPFNMLLGVFAYDNSVLMRGNELGRWIYCPLRSLPDPIRYRLDVQYLSGWRNYGVRFADPGNDEPRAPSFPTQLY